MTNADHTRALALQGLTAREIREHTGYSRQAIRDALAHLDTPKKRPGPKRTRCDVCQCAKCGATIRRRRS